ncbi:MAG TPA: serine/threonine-protein kinase [Pirellulales bacterium]
MSLPSVEQFWAWLVQSRLFSDDQFAALREQFLNEKDVKGLCPKLILGRQLTRWQCQQLLLGRYRLTLSKYKLLDQLGRGGMGTVFKARHATNGRIVALKVVRGADVESSGGLARFQREVQVVAALNHPHIVAAFDADQDGEVQFLVMEYVQGRDLSYWIREYGRLPVDWTCECVRQAAIGLQHAYEKGLVHRDIKPSNLLVVAENVLSRPMVKILDLGMARYSDREDDQELTLTGQILGTPDYIAPEQAEDTSGADIRADIFSLGCTLFKALAGQVPFSGRNSMEKLMARARRDAPRLRSIRPGVSVELDEVVARMLARDPQRRYQTPQEVADALERFTTFSPKARRSFDPATSEPLSADVSADAADGDTLREEDEEETGAQLQAFFESVAAASDGDSTATSARPLIAAKKAANADDSDRNDGFDLGPASSVSARSSVTEAHDAPAQSLAGSSSESRRASKAEPEKVSSRRPRPKPGESPAAAFVARSETVKRFRDYLQPRARWLIGAALLLFCGAAGFAAWNAGRSTAGAGNVARAGANPKSVEPAVYDKEFRFEGIPIGGRYEMTLATPDAGRYRLTLRVREGVAGSDLRAWLRDEMLLDAPLKADQIGPDARIPLGTLALPAGTHPFAIELRAEPAAKSPLSFQPWDFVGPFSGESPENAFRTAFGPENDPSGQASYPRSQGAPQFAPIDLGTDRVKPIGNVSGAALNEVFYLRRVIRSSRAEKLKVEFAFDGRIGAWCNGTSLLFRPEAPVRSDAVVGGTADLKPGDNVLLLKLAPTAEDAKLTESYDQGSSALIAPPFRFSVRVRSE